jgi:protein gp37
MGAKSKIGWTDASWNFATGCTRVSPGCDHCYAFAFHDKMHAAFLEGKGGIPIQYREPFSVIQVIPDRLMLPLRWRKARRVFVNSMGDFFHKEIGPEVLIEALGVMAATPQHTYQILTKRPQRMEKFMNIEGLKGAIQDMASSILEKGVEIDWPLPNVWMGVSVESQDYTWRIGNLVGTPAVVRFLSCEPLLGELDLREWLPDLQWIIVGGESGPEFRKMQNSWVQDIHDQVKDAGLPLFVKQGSGRLSSQRYDLREHLFACQEFPE